ncbi:tripartite tricarboxylate transporter substrate binding protein [Anoxynatronum buryatiense]|uniref:Tripartite-type tricarboxylate transporter, receptor component TctC n=1 Tax=Anoxynatronum buryatiense TaxID=489973 RepID=A0AA45WUH6_9CLOT|nr:tripartite tricarboxylate transporter substrate binding protein [Anoxynatronum buryatiense]SMP44040.1 Tripartite-type tricarboxylate transporter, receptor component TctC [Anoxynatronum buryatiense]
MRKAFIWVLMIFMVISLAACGSNQEPAAGSAGETGESEGSALDGYPSKPVEVIVAYAAGGGTDVGARLLLSEAEKILGQPMVVLNIEGAGGEIGFTELAKADPDGYTIGFINLPTFVSLPMDRETQYAVEDVRPIVNHVFDPGVLVVRGDSPWETFEQFVDYVKENPGTVAISNNGAGASNHIGAAHLEYEAGIEVIHAPFDGTTNMLAALRGSHVDATVAKISEVADLVNAGELRLLASYTARRIEEFPEVPTLGEFGYEILFGSARALVAPAGVPDEIIDHLADVFHQAIVSDEHMAKAREANLPIMYMGPDELRYYMVNEAIYLEEIKPLIGM